MKPTPISQPSLWGFYLGGGLDWFLGSTTAIEGQAGIQRFDEENFDPQANILAKIGLFFFLPPEGESRGRAPRPRHDQRPADDRRPGFLPMEYFQQ